GRGGGGGSGGSGGGLCGGRGGVRREGERRRGSLKKSAPVGLLHDEGSSRMLRRHYRAGLPHSRSRNRRGWTISLEILAICGDLSQPTSQTKTLAASHRQELRSAPPPMPRRFRPQGS